MAMPNDKSYLNFISGLPFLSIYIWIKEEETRQNTVQLCPSKKFNTGEIVIFVARCLGLVWQGSTSGFGSGSGSCRSPAKRVTGRTAPLPKPAKAGALFLLRRRSHKTKLLLAPPSSGRERTWWPFSRPTGFLAYACFALPKEEEDPVATISFSLQVQNRLVLVKYVINHKNINKM